MPTTVHVLPQLEPMEPRRLLAAGHVLFIRGGSGTGGFYEGGSLAQRDEQLADINNASTAANNKGWGSFAARLRAEGFTVSQATEGSGGGAGTPVDLASMNLSQYVAIVFGSNNAVYPAAAVDAVEQYVRNGGGALFISDANFGSNWRDAPDSDQQFLSRFGLTVQQDQGTYVLDRSAGDFVVGSHPILAGVNRFDGEGVSPIRVTGAAPPGVTRQILVRAKNNTRDNNGTNSSNKFQGSSRPTDSSDGALVVANADFGRVVGHFDRNTFFNDNGIGTDLTRYDNALFATNLVRWLAGQSSEFGSLSGVVFDDRNSNGTRQVGSEPGIAGRTVYLDLNNNGKRDSSEPRRLSDPAGNFRFDGLTPGTYKLRQTLPNGWRQTNPANGFGFTHVVQAGQEIGNRRFGQTNKPLIGGRVFADANRNGRQDAGESGLSGRRVFWDVNGDGRWSSDEASTLTDSIGSWTISTLPAGTYRFAIVGIAGFEPTTPASVLVTASRGQLLQSVNFGQRSI